MNQHQTDNFPNLPNFTHCHCCGQPLSGWFYMTNGLGFCSNLSQCYDQHLYNQQQQQQQSQNG